MKRLQKARATERMFPEVCVPSTDRILRSLQSWITLNEGCTDNVFFTF